MTEEEMAEQIKEHFRKLLNDPPKATWPREITFSDDHPIKKARIHENGDVEIMPMQPLNWVEVTFTLDVPMTASERKDWFDKIMR